MKVVSYPAVFGLLMTLSSIGSGGDGTLPFNRAYMHRPAGLAGYPELTIELDDVDSLDLTSGLSCLDHTQDSLRSASGKLNYNGELYVLDGVCGSTKSGEFMAANGNKDVHVTGEFVRSGAKLYLRGEIFSAKEKKPFIVELDESTVK